MAEKVSNKTKSKAKTTAKPPKAAKKPAAAKAAAAKPDTEKQTKKQTRSGPGMGHNLTAVREASGPAMKRLFRHQADMDEDMAGYRGEFKIIYDEEAAKIGCKPSILRKEFRRAVRIKKELEAEKKLASEEQDEIDMLRASMEGTELGDFFLGVSARDKTSDTLEETASTLIKNGEQPTAPTVEAPAAGEAVH